MIRPISLSMAKSDLAARFLRGAWWSVVGALISNGLTVLTGVLLARILNKEPYGQYVLIQSTLSTVGVFAGLGIGAASTKFSAEMRRNSPARLLRLLALAERSVVCLGIGFAAAIAIGSNWMASTILNSSTLQPYLAMGSVAVAFAAVDGYQKCVLIGFEAMRAFALASSVGAFVNFIAAFAGAAFLGLQGAVIGSVIASIGQAGLSWTLARRQVAEASSGSLLPHDDSEIRTLFGFAIPALIATSMLTPAHWAAQAILVRRGGFEQVAILGVSMQWFGLVLFLPSTAARVVGPMLTEYVTSKDNRAAGAVLKYATLANALIALPVATVLALFSPMIISLYGQAFKGNSTALVVAVATAGIVAIQVPVGNLVAATSRMWLGVLMNAGWAATYIGLSALWASNGAVGVLVALLCAYTLHALWTFWFAKVHAYEPSRGVARDARS